MIPHGQKWQHARVMGSFLNSNMKALRFDIFTSAVWIIMNSFLIEIINVTTMLTKFHKCNLIRLSIALRQIVSLQSNISLMMF